jgi:hypothetical protein
VIERRSCPSESRLELSEKASLNGFRRAATTETVVEPGAVQTV